jgi:hypothetical protein
MCEKVQVPRREHDEHEHGKYTKERMRNRGGGSRYATKSTAAAIHSLPVGYLLEGA